MSPKAIRKRRIKAAKSAAGWIGFSLALALILITIASSLDPVAGHKELSGTVVMLEPPTPETRGKVKVKLENGATVSVERWFEEPLPLGTKILVRETTTSVFKKKSRHFIRVLENPA